MSTHSLPETVQPKSDRERQPPPAMTPSARTHAVVEELSQETPCSLALLSWGGYSAGFLLREMKIVLLVLSLVFRCQCGRYFQNA